MNKIKIIIANWKLNPLKVKQAKELAQVFNKVKTKNKVVICPPVLFLPLIRSKFDLGAQNIAEEEQGPFTGEISGSMLKQFKVKYAIIGHSERRALGETDDDARKKIVAALNNKISPILCVGYGIGSDQKEGDVLMHLQYQLSNCLENFSEAERQKIIVAYEPVWAIGSGHAASPEHAERVAMFIKIKFKIKKVLYGGSSSQLNYREFLDRDIDGLLVGAASLDKIQFAEMISY